MDDATPNDSAPQPFHGINPDVVVPETDARRWCFDLISNETPAEHAWELGYTVVNLHGQNDALRRTVAYMQGREQHFARILGVADGGQYRADWNAAIKRIVEERDALRNAVDDHASETERLLADLRAAESRSPRERPVTDSTDLAAANNRMAAVAQALGCDLDDSYDTVLGTARTLRAQEHFTQKEGARFAADLPTDYDGLRTVAMGHWRKIRHAENEAKNARAKAHRMSSAAGELRSAVKHAEARYAHWFDEANRRTHQVARVSEILNQSGDASETVALIRASLIVHSAVGGGYTIPRSEREKAAAFREEHDRLHAGQDQGAIGGRFSTTFCDTSIGDVITLRCACGASVDVSGDL